jgi:hypothetical protein
MGTDNEPVPVTGFAANFSPIPRIAPPPVGKLRAGSGVEDPADSWARGGLSVRAPDIAPVADGLASPGCMKTPNCRMRQRSSDHFMSAAQMQLPIFAAQKGGPEGRNKPADGRRAHIPVRQLAAPVLAEVSIRPSLFSPRGPDDVPLLFQSIPQFVHRRNALQDSFVHFANRTCGHHRASMLEPIWNDGPQHG